ncbi:MAG: hypothetical protein BGO37_06795 [Cellulomonas sp. 73-92]|uniref:SCO6880 family protein n=1 Tax=Cellulomonas sp. 73-92 TaxID=1895740 RepID=UPI0009271CB6|nr:SCO6880 family protein [Cellulomonas sp. 73-92]OJV75939.1 MAG: hypothetical protein BGO37_06795 [Cellulomonas sp. 73-92]
MATSSRPVELSAVKFSRLTTRGLLLGLSVPQVTVLAVAAAVFVVSLYVGGPAVAYTVPAWAGGVGLALVKVAGRPLVGWVPLVGHWWLRRAVGQTSYRRHLTRPRPAGTLALPGDAAPLRQLQDLTTGAVMVHDPHAGTLTVLLEVTHPSFALMDPAEQERRVHAWGRVLATVCRSGRIGRLQVLERTLPDSGSGLAAWWRDHGHDDGSWAARTYTELIERAGPAGERHTSTLSLSLDLHAASRAIRAAGGGLKGAARVLAQEMTTLTTALRAADLRPSPWYTPAQLALMLRTAYDPQTAPTLDRAEQAGRDLATAGPVAVEESWDRLRSDSAFHAVLWISQWPRSLVYPGFLAPILLSSGIRRSFSLLCDPVRFDQAARDIRKQKTEYLSDTAQRQRIGQIEDAALSAEFQDVLQQEADLTAGHALVRYSGLIAVSAPTSSELDGAVAAIEQAAIQAACETRRLVGQQAQGFVAAALPLARGV